MIPDHWQRALEQRRQHFDLTETATLRLLHAEDPHIRCDRFGPVCWFYCYSEPTSDHLAAMPLFTEAAGGQYWCAQHMQQRGRDPQARQQHYADMPDEWVATEEGLSFYLRRTQGLSPGLFLDQRANRRWLRTASSGCRVLNLFSYTGGFSLNAAAGGALQVVSVDLSRPSLDWSRANFSLNDIDDTQHEFWSADARYFLRGCAKRGRRFDIVVCDPPSFGRGPSGVFRIEKDLDDMLDQIDAVLNSNGILFFSTNYEQWDQRAFVERVQRALPPARYRVINLPLPDADVGSGLAAHDVKAIALSKA